MTQVNIYRAKAQLSALIDDAMSGGEVVIARNGKPCVRLVPVEPPKRSFVMPWAGEPLVDVHGNVYERTAENLAHYEWTDEEIAEMVDAPILTQGDDELIVRGRR